MVTFDVHVSTIDLHVGRNLFSQVRKKYPKRLKSSCTLNLQRAKPDSPPPPPLRCIKPALSSLLSFALELSQVRRELRGRGGLRISQSDN